MANENPTAAEQSVLIEKGENPSALVIAFSGFAGQLMMYPFEFFQLSGLLKYSRILLRENAQTCYLGGISTRPSYETLLKFLQDAITELSPEKVIAVGTSGGGYAALLFGHALKIDYVHAFSPYTYVDNLNILKYCDEDILRNRWQALAQIWSLPPALQRFFDLREVLGQSNGKSRYNIHICQNNKWDKVRADHLQDCQGVRIFRYPCETHMVARVIAKQRLLHHLLEIENQERLDELFQGREKPEA